MKCINCGDKHTVFIETARGWDIWRCNKCPFLFRHRVIKESYMITDNWEGINNWIAVRESIRK